MTGLWVAVGSGTTLVIARLLKLRQPATPAPRAVAWRHAIITAIAASVAIGLSVYWSAPHGYWAVVTLCLVLQPFRGETTRKAVDRSAGTAAGAVLAGVLALALPWPLALTAAACCALLMLGWAVAAQERRQAIYLTPVVVLIGSSGLSSSALDLALERVLLSAVGAGFAVVAAMLVHAYDSRHPLDHA